MSLILVAFISLLGIIFGKLLFKVWLNHLTIYCVIWGVMIFAYELKLIPYPDIIPLAWFYIGATFLTFLLGILTVISATKLYNRDFSLPIRSDIKLNIFLDNGKTVKYAIIFFSIISLLAAIQNWIVLIKMFGSIPFVFLNATKIYRLTTTGGVDGVIPHISSLGYVAVFFAGIYTAFKGKFTFLTFFPFFGIVLKDLAIFGRGATLLALMEFLFCFFLFRNLLKTDIKRRFKFSKVNAVIFSTILIAFLVISASLVKISRSGGEAYAGQSRALNQLKNNIFISPSVYLYLSSDVGVLSKYLESEGENAKFGQNTFLPVYDFLAKFEILEKPNHYQKGYYIPMWTNTATFIREINADFGILGTFLIPYLLGLIITWLWFRFYKKQNLIVFTLLVYFYLMIGFSFLVMVTRITSWSISLIVILLCIPIIEKIATSLKFRKHN